MSDTTPAPATYVFCWSRTYDPLYLKMIRRATENTYEVEYTTDIREARRFSAEHFATYLNQYNEFFHGSGYMQVEAPQRRWHVKYVRPAPIDEGFVYLTPAGQLIAGADLSDLYGFEHESTARDLLLRCITEGFPHTDALFTLVRR